MARQKRLPVLGSAVALAASPQGGRAKKCRKLNAAAGLPLHAKSAHVARLECATIALRPGTPPGGGLLPCRAAERKKISAHLRAGVEQGGSTQVLYVSGMPGTGKTAIVLEALEHLRKQHQFFLVHVNAMMLGSPAQVFREVADKMNCQTTNSEACHDVAEMFKTRTAADPVVVLLIDEVDCLVTPTQAVLYKVFDWLGMPKARLVLAAISNTMDLPERLLPRVASRFHIERVDFSPYHRDQLYEILCSRLRGQSALDAFGDVVLRLCAAKVAAATGDIRKALQVCRRAAEIRLQTADSEGPVTIANLTAAEKELILANPMAQAVMGLSTQARRFLSAVVIELRRKEADMVLYRKAAHRFQRLVSMAAVSDERGSLPEEASNTSELSDWAELMVERLEKMSILRKQENVPTTESTCSGPVLSLGSLDVEDLTNTLLKLEEDPAVRELLEGGSLNSEAVRTFKKID